MDDRTAHVARLRELSTAQQSRALTTDELCEVAQHFRALGDETRAARAEQAAAAGAPKPSAEPPAPTPTPPPSRTLPGYPDDPAEADYRVIITRVQSALYTCKDVTLRESTAEDIIRRARSGTNTYPRMLKRFGELVGAECLPPLPIPLACAICGSKQAATKLRQQAPYVIKTALTIYSLMGMNSQWLDLNELIRGTVAVDWRLCTSCHDAVAERLLAIAQHRSRLLAARKAAGGLGALLQKGKRQQTADAAAEALREIGYTPLAGDCYDLPRVLEISGEMGGNEVTNSGSATRRVEFAAASQPTLDAIEDAAHGHGWRPVRLPSVRAVSVYELALDLAARFDEYQLLGGPAVGSPVDS